jgi:DNA (cytosine-5)-methyltransferase 1
MRYNSRITKTLIPDITEKELVVDLFAGCGGLSLGFEAAGYRTVGYEMNTDAFKTYNRNLKGNCLNEKLTFITKFPKAEILIGGPPCQPFSVIGNQLGLNDNRNGFPICIEAVKKIKPKIFLFENVRGLMFKNKWYLESLVEEFRSLKYNVEVQILNAKNFDVPQNRERVIIIGYKNGKFKFPAPVTRLITSGEALGRMALSIPTNIKLLSQSMHQYIARYEKASKCVTNRDLHLDRPARTLTCRNLAGSTGDMHRIKMPSGEKRRLTIKEAARLQSFPDFFKFDGNETSVYNQIGNAVPPMLAYHLAQSIKAYLNKRLKESSKAKVAAKAA